MQIVHVPSLQREFISVTVESNRLLYLFIISFSDVHTIGEHDVLVNSENGSVQLYWHLMIKWSHLKCLFIYLGNPRRKIKTLGAEVDVVKKTGITDPFLKVVICVDVGEVCVGICFSC